jgi:uncharacterized repeat protein (TIGR01451 family)
VSAITLTSGTNATGVNFGELLPASLGNRLWVDTNGDGLQNDGATGIASRTVTLFSGGADGLLSTEIDNTTITTTTDADGIYGFANLTPGEYEVLFGDKPNSTVFTTADAGTDDTVDSDADGSGLTGVITLVAGENNTTLDAGVYIPVSIGDFVWNDANSNGLQDAGEQGIANLAVSLLAADGSQLATTTTNGVGLYNFENLKPGTYQVQVTTPTGFTATTKGTNPTSATDSNINATGRTDLITLGSGEANLSIDAGFRLLGGSLPGGGGPLPGGDLQITKTDGLTSVVAGQRITYTIEVKNVGSSAVSGVVVNDVMPTNLTNVTWTSTVLGNGTATGNDATGTGNINDTITSLGANSTVRYTVSATVYNPVVKSCSSSSATTHTTITNTVTVAGPSGFVDSNTTNNSATDLDTMLSAPGCRTPGFWVNKNWQKFWDGVAGNEPSQSGTTNFATGDLFHSPYTSSQQPGKVLDSVTGTYQAGVLIGDWNRNGLTDNGEQSIFYTTAEALKVLNSSQQPDKNDVRYTIARSLVASWLNYVAGNPVDTAATNDVDARVLINRGITWLQTYTPDENRDGKGDGMLSKLSSSISNTAMKASNTAWTTANTGGNAIHTGLDNYNNGRGLAGGSFYGGNP